MPILEGRLSSNRDLSESYDLLDRKIVRPLERVPGVAQVRLDGVNPREVRINLRTADIEPHRVDVRDINRALRGSNFDMSLGKVTEGETRFTARVVGAFVSVDEIANLPIRADGLRLRDIADVRYEEPPLEYGRHLDGEFAIGVTVSQEAKANTVEVCDAVEARIEAMGADPELEGVNFLVWFSQGKEIKKMLKDLTFTGVFGGLLAAIVLFGFLRRIATTLVCAMCIPFSLDRHLRTHLGAGEDAQHPRAPRSHRRDRDARRQRGRRDGEHLPPPRGGLRPPDGLPRRARRKSRSPSSRRRSPRSSFFSRSSSTSRAR